MTGARTPSSSLLVRLVTTRWSFSFLLGPLYWSSIFPTSREHRNVVQLWTAPLLSFSLFCWSRRCHHLRNPRHHWYVGHYHHFYCCLSHDLPKNSRNIWYMHNFFWQYCVPCFPSWDKLVINLRLLSSQTVSMAGRIVVNVSWLIIMMVLLAKSQRAIDSTYCKLLS